VNNDYILLEQLYLNKIKPNLSANNTETQSPNIPDNAKAPVDYGHEQQETKHASEPETSKSRSGWIEKINKTDLDKSTVGVTGFGIVELGQLKKNISNKFEDLSKRIMNNEPVFVYKRIKEKYGFLMHAIKALIEIERDIEKMRRAGKMPGMLKRYNFSS